MKGLIKYIIKSKGFNGVLQRWDPYDKDMKEYFIMIHKKENVNLPGLSQKELKILKKIRKYAYRLDYSGCYFCCEIRLGWSAIIGMIPIIGDIINLYLSIRLINRCINIKIPKNVIIQMYINIFIAFLIGTIPMIGDMLFIYYKCNIRNYILLEKTLKEREKIAFELVYYVFSSS